MYKIVQNCAKVCGVNSEAVLSRIHMDIGIAVAAQARD